MRRIRGVLVLLNVLIFVLVLLGTTSSTSAETSVVFGQDYKKTKTAPVTSTDSFTVINPGAGYTLRVFNGGEHGLSTPVSSAVVSLNGRQILGPSDFDRNVRYLERAVRLEARNTIVVELRGSIASFLAIVIDNKGHDNNWDGDKHNDKHKDKDKEENSNGSGNGEVNGNGGGNGNGNVNETVPPSIQSTVSPASNSNGWNNSNVTVSFTCSDASGIASCSGPTIVSTNGGNQVVTGTAVDRAGNTATTSVTINLDKAPPSITATAAPAANAGGWNNTDVTVSFVCSDALSGIASCPSPTIVSTSSTNQSVTGTVVDNAGNTSTATATVNIDKSSPSIVATLAPAANANGWNKTDVTVTFTCSDALSGTMSCPAPTTLSNNGADQSVSGTTTDRAGNTATTTATVNLDKDSPSIVASATPAANTNGWNNSDVTITFTCSDALSGSDNCSGPTTLSANGANQTVTGTAADKAGNTATTTANVSVDKSLPTISATASPSPNANGWNNSDVTVTFTCGDALSGIADCPSPVTLTTSGVSLAANGAAMDRAGNIENTSVVINLDKAGPSVSLWPYASTVPAAEFTLSGSAPDALSGLVGVTCNGVHATISGSDFSCTLTLLEGPNTIQIVALDWAGNSTTTSTNVNFVAFVPPPFGPNAVSWIRSIGVTGSGNSLTKNGSSVLWNAGANSKEVLRDGYGFVEFTATETNTMRMAGLGSTDTNQDYTDVDYGTLMRGDGSLAIYESGVYRGEFGSYAAGDRFRVEVRYGVVRYLRNGVLFFTSPAPIRYPLRVDTAFLTPGATLTDVRVGNFVWSDGVGVRISGESVTKTGSPGWNAGAISTNTIESGDGFMEFSASETNTSRIGGLGNLVTGVAVSDIQFGIMLNSSGNVEVMEGGTNRGTFGAYAPGDRFRIEARLGAVNYYRNSVLFYTSLQAPVFPLRADSAFDTPGGTLTDVILEPLNWLGTDAVYANGGLLIKKTLDGWTTAASSGSNILSGDGYFEFTAIETNKRRGLGLKSEGLTSTLQDIDYLMSLNENGTVEVIELGTSRGLFGTYQNGDRFRVEIQNGIVRYRRNGVLLFSSAVSPAYPLRAEAALYSKDATLVDVDFGDLVWMNGVNMRTAGHALAKVSTSAAWDSGAASTRTTTSGYMEFTASEASMRIAGLSNGDTNQDYTDIDFAILLRPDTSVAIYEAGIFRGNFGTYVAGDRFCVEVQAGTVRYLKNGALFYTSTLHPVAALRVDTGLNGANATLYNIIFR